MKFGKMTATKGKIKYFQLINSQLYSQELKREAFYDAGCLSTKNHLEFMYLYNVRLFEISMAYYWFLSLKVFYIGYFKRFLMCKIMQVEFIVILAVILSRHMFYGYYL